MKVYTDQTGDLVIASASDPIVATYHGILFPPNDDARFALQDLIAAVSDETGCDKQSALRDLLTELHHAAEWLHLDFDAAIHGAAMVYAEETHEPANPSDSASALVR